MRPKLLSRQNPAIKRKLDFSEKEINPERSRRINVMRAKHYPCIFLDQRLRSSFNEHTIYRAK